MAIPRIVTVDTVNAATPPVRSVLTKTCTIRRNVVGSSSARNKHKTCVYATDVVVVTDSAREIMSRILRTWLYRGPRAWTRIRRFPKLV